MSKFDHPISVVITVTSEEQLAGVYAFLGGASTNAIAAAEPVKVAEKEIEAAVIEGPSAPAIEVVQSGDAELDAAGIAWNADKHASTKAKVGSGLWRMKVGVKRLPGEGEDSPNYVKPGNAPGAAALAAGPGSPPPAPIAAPLAPPVDPNRPTDAAYCHNNGDGTEQWYVNGAWDGGKHPIPAPAAPAAPAEDDEFAQFATAAAAPVVAAARKWSDADLSKLCNQCAVKDGNPERVKPVLAKYVPEGEVQHSRNIPEANHEEFASELEAVFELQYAG
jgi:hypothetical protein